MPSTIQLNGELVNRLRNIANKTGRSMNQIAAELIDRSLAIADLAAPAVYDAGRKNGNERNGADSELAAARPGRVVLSAEESLRRMKDFKNRKDDFIAAIRKSKG